MECMAKLIEMRVLIVGMRGLGVETAKNLILAGPKSVHIHDPTIVSIADRGANFNIEESHIGTVSRAEASINQLKELNSTVQVSVLVQFSEAEITKDKYDVVVITENLFGSEILEQIDQKCRESKIGFILAENMGLASYVFVDYGLEHVVTDRDGETTKQSIVT